MSEPIKVKPLFLIKPKSMSPRDIRRAEKLAGICIAECEAPEQARFLEPPLDATIDAQARAALALMRYVIDNTTNPSTIFYGANLVKWFVEKLIAAPTVNRVPPVTKSK